MGIYSESDYPFKIGDKVHHVKYKDKIGKIIDIDRMFRHPTSCTVEVFNPDMNRTILEQWWTDRMSVV